jgi:hypothetical protein
MPANYPDYVLAERAQEDPTGPRVNPAAREVQINAAFSQLSMLAHRQPDRWRLLVLLNCAVESLREATPEGPGNAT